MDKIVIAPHPHKIDKDGRRHYLIRAIPYQDPQQEAERLKAVHEARVKIVPRVVSASLTTHEPVGYLNDEAPMYTGIAVVTIAVITISVGSACSRRLVAALNLGCAYLIGMSRRVEMRLENKVALITGGYGGMGRASARLFAAEGATVFVAGRSADRGEALVAEINDGGREGAFRRAGRGQPGPVGCCRRAGQGAGRSAARAHEHRGFERAGQVSRG